MLRSIATVSISGTLPEKLHAIAAAGYQGVEIFENDLLYYTGTPRDIRNLAAELGLKITLFQPFRDFEGASRAQFAANLQRAKRKFALMHELGCDTMLLCSNVQPDCSADIELQVADLRALADLAEQEGVVIGYEALAWGTHVNRWRQAWERVQRVNSPAMGIVLDSFHILSLGDDLQGLAEVPVEKITFLQLADAPLMKMDVLEWSRHFRCFPGQGQLPLVDFACELTRCGYRGPWSLEIFNDGFRASPTGATAKDGYRSLLWLEEQTRRQLADSDAALFSPPALPHYDGLEFIEFAASPAESVALGQRLTQLGFKLQGKHRSKQVALWRNGEARVIVNAQPHSWADHFHQRHGISLCAMALRVSHSAPVVERARAYGYATWQGDAGPNESSIPAVCAPDGSLIYLVETGDDIYARDFHLQADAPRDDYCGIDHLALGMEADSRDNWIIFFRTVFGFSLEHEQTLPDPYGLVRSLAVHSPQGNIRLALNISQSRATQIARSVACYQGAGLQHAAFACRDLPATLENLPQAALNALPIPANYYEDLLARFGGESQVETLQRLQILYDRDTRGGEFLHLYTRPFAAGRFFFELTERRDGYAQYGAVNAAVRLSAMQYS
ncbi:TPA: sugar phosphate isomerase/epimerase and 4-hydroxyphenylpyruvate domain-containing protein [Klebsiella aerogenes]|jgi:4-hydroxyphenylpyruvate dioxygenase|uniref:bifunctional sugar phosphate isomerase/epimerase/4-hydroxyphenylpyruvate dioxygenase family protein n=1 Tax=Klebsiella TaxID=570 RepID=UPI0006505678|nr:sugar phosphate isomerase/epimerase and 4-hydroxyphenylpyruvate domain-containing protein [Klebsiella aerogenes]EIV2479343.1 sugar phosphate isomerase/epimerase and 4-hydroxyphenylpyruvate domain-containing protein [Klebsiella aerogenes]EJL5443167.1 sugar phosphate isomerase/epimerase and 4-hydroxyphenylpyruvate domain-containing protein [Klebsiella aerogenes]EKY1832190.1 sugar phosphate isomerase/epimerase and 4-hydroxyphenylpyruvate domain-containing protein [Klebsiella aerogenes]EKZ316787